MSPLEARLCEQLLDACELRTDADFGRYTAALEGLAGSSDPEVLRTMLSALRDTDAGEIQYELVEAAEAFPGAVYATALVTEAEVADGAAPRWFRLMLQSALNAPSMHGWLRAALASAAPACREHVLRLVRALASEDPKYLDVLRVLES